MNEIFDIFEELMSDDEEIINFVERPRRRKQFRQRKNHFEEWDDEAFLDRFRLSKDCILAILEQIEEQISYLTDRNEAVDALTQLLLTLRFYASGSMIIVAGDFGGIHKSTASRIIARVTRAIASLAQHYIKMPSTDEEKAQTTRKFYNVSRFPKVIGAIDCTHVRIQSPGGDDAERYRNRKGYFSINVQTVCDAELRIQNIVARWPGSVHDSTIFGNSRLKALMETDYQDYFLVGDSGYPVENYLMTPLLNPNTPAQHLYNEAQIRTRNVVERSYGVWKRRFAVLSLGLRVKLTTTLNIIVATAVLHNIAINMKVINPPPVEVNIENVEWDVAVYEERHGRDNVRTNLIDNYFSHLL
ncbi:putative nuclease HARBI1 [Photinus pyralis]|nr:putative nuclease HARBI1 [Photinus pyralis]XP_031341734.1 putative nuclease HARBI1 [Photinus pyralis]XP_031345539.1 putative nuclease HARBI1 [Photinus pyralis]XP_031351351.1 putative nuclease HARBI1 [Photinus pyralis]